MKGGPTGPPDVLLGLVTCLSAETCAHADRVSKIVPMIEVLRGKLSGALSATPSFMGLRLEFSRLVRRSTLLPLQCG